MVWFKLSPICETWYRKGTVRGQHVERIRHRRKLISAPLFRKCLEKSCSWYKYVSQDNLEQALTQNLRFRLSVDYHLARKICVKDFGR
jgi:hypothetical protein